jgi:hypothetical protein
MCVVFQDLSMPGDFDLAQDTPSFGKYMGRHGLALSLAKARPGTSSTSWTRKHNRDISPLHNTHREQLDTDTSKDMNDKRIRLSVSR